MASIIKKLNKQTGVTYVYESESYWDKEKKQPRSKRKLIGRIDEETGEIVPTGGRGKTKKREAAERAKRLLERVGLEPRILKQFPKMMSGGEQQRVAIARAVAAGGEIILADEPTGNLDSENEKKIVALLKDLAHEDNYTVIVITHNPNVAEETDHVFRMKDGELTQVR